MRTRPFLFSFQTFHSFDEETAAKLRSRQHWEKFGNYLVSDFVIESTNEPLAESGVISNLRIMIGKASEKFKLSSFEDGMFYSCLDSTNGTDSARWLKKFSTNISREMFKRQQQACSASEEKNPLYYAELLAINKGYSKANTGVAAIRKFSTTVHRLGAGRSAEPSNVIYNGCLWNPFHTCVRAEWDQDKVSRKKFVAMVAGFDPACCIFTTWGDRQIMCGGLASFAYEEHAPYLCPDLAEVANPGKKLGLYYKEAGPEKAFFVAEHDGEASGVQEDRSAADVRPACVDELIATVPVDFAVITTGHDLKGASALYEYFTMTMGMAMPGAIVLAGWPPFEWGRSGKGPKPASLAAMEVMLAATKKEKKPFPDPPF